MIARAAMMVGIVPPLSTYPIHARCGAEKGKMELAPYSAIRLGVQIQKLCGTKTVPALKGNVPSPLL